MENIETPSLKFVTKLPDKIRCVGIIEFKGEVLVATEKAVYKLKGNILKPIPFLLDKPPPMAAPERVLNGKSERR